jgi:cytochrome c-type biogenesis protein CcmH
VITFVVIAALLVAVALAWLLPPFLRRDAGARQHDRTQVNLGLLRGQLAELEAEKARGALSDAQYVEGKAELERRVLDEAETETRVAAGPTRGGRVVAALVAAVVPVAAGLIYVALGDPGALDLQTRMALDEHSKQPTAQEIETMLTRLKQRLEKQPQNADGWAMLARSYYILQRYPEAALAYERLLALVPEEPSVLVDYADALAMIDGRKISGRPLELVQQALKIDPKQAKALAMAGTEAFDRKDFRAAVDYWERLRALVPADSEVGQNIAGSIAEARTRGGIEGGPPVAANQTKPEAKPAAPGGGASVQGTVRLDPALAARAAPTDTVFVFARASEGPRVPLAVLKLQAKDLPAKFVLDDSLAMAPQFRLSNFKSVLVNARVSKSGGANPTAGDLEGRSVAVDLGARDVVLTIDRVLP